VSVFFALAFLTMGTDRLGTVIRDWDADPRLADHLLSLGWAVLVLPMILIAWRDTNVRLRPDGLWQRGVTGWLVVPWEAAPTVASLPPSPTATTVRLDYGRPELVRRRGIHLSPHRLRTDSVDPRLLAAAIRYYGDRPEHRPAIGTRAEYDRLMAALLDAPAAAIAGRWR
jgi:hypothetical protein